MTAAANKALIARAFDRLSEGDPTLFIDAMADDIVWIVTGQSAWSGWFEGKDTVERELAAPLFALFEGPYRNHATRIVADEEGDVVVLAKGEAVTKTGNRYDNDYCFVMRLRDGKVVEVREYMDSALAERALGEPQR